MVVTVAVVETIVLGTRTIIQKVGVLAAITVILVSLITRVVAALVTIIMVQKTETVMTVIVQQLHLNLLLRIY